MYYFFNCPKRILRHFVPSNITGIISSKSFALCAIFNSSQIIVFENKNNSIVAYYCRCEESLDIYGNSINLEWNSDGSLIAIGTDKGFLLIFSVKTVSQEVNVGYQNEKEFLEEGFINRQLSLFGEIILLDVISFPYKISCICLYRDDLLVAIEDGTLSRIKWNGSLLYNQEFNLTSISFFSDLEFSKASNLSKNEAICRNIEWLPSLSGVIVLFKNGKSAFLHIPNHKLLSEQITGVWAENLRNVTCSAVNVKFRSIAYGLKIGEAVIYKTDEETGALRLQHRLKILSNEYPDADKVTGAVTYLKWSPDNFCLALCWEYIGFSLWSVQGSLLFSSLGNKAGIDMSLLSLDWGCEGYSLWLIEKPDKSGKPAILIFQMAKSVLVVNPTKNNHEHLLLLSSSHIIFGPRKLLSSSETNLEYIPYPENYVTWNWPIKYAAIDLNGSRLVISGKHGFALYFFVSKKWRLFGNETQERTIEVSGGIVWYNHIVGLACFDNKEGKFEIRLYDSLQKIDNSLSTNHPVNSQILLMNIFDNTLVVLSIDGSIGLFEITLNEKSHDISMEYIQTIPLENYIEFAACIVSFNLSSLHTEIGHNKDVDELIRYQSLLINYSGHLLLFQRDKSFSAPRTSDKSLNSQENSFFKLAFKNTLIAKQKITFTGPLVVAYNVEIMWTPIIDEEFQSKMLKLDDWNAKIYTMENSLWLNCGSQGLRVWLPLNGGSNVTQVGEKKSKYSFLSKRIMLTFKIRNFYPLVVLNNEALLMSPMNEFSNDFVNTPTCLNLSFSSINKNRHIFLQHIVKELLRINLGIHALDLTFELKKLPYFNHSLELLLHEVLEEEATSKEPIPDPLLPRVVAFIQEFPNFLRTVVQCARKTELALWSYLFESAGNPKDLFESCLMNNELDTAASYLIILQNIEHPLISQKQAILLLDAALNRSNWGLVSNLIRFLKNIVEEVFKYEHARNEFKMIEKGNYKSTKETYSSFNTKKRYRSGGGIGMATSRQYSTGKIKDIEILKSSKSAQNGNIDENCYDDLVFDSVGSKINTLLSPNLNVDDNNDGLSFMCNQMHLIEENPDLNLSRKQIELSDLLFECSKNSVFEKEVDIILTQFALKNFQEYHLHNVMEFFVNIQLTEFQFVSWMIRERSCSKIQDPIQAFVNLHIDFKWPLTRESEDFNKMQSYTEFASKGDFFEVLCKIRNNKVMGLNRKKLRYLATMLIKANYYEWSFLVLLMLDDYEEILSIFKCFLMNVDKISKLFEIKDFINTIMNWNFDEKTTYMAILSKIKSSIILLYEEKISEMQIPKVDIISERSLSEVSPKTKEDLLILSPVSKHSSIALGQLIIDPVNIKENDLNHYFKQSESIDCKLDQISGNKQIKKVYLSKTKLTANDCKISENLRSAYGFSNSIQTVKTLDPLISSELEEKSFASSCFIS